MQQPESVRAELVTRWFTRAEEDYHVADRLLADTNPYLTAVVFHAQQAAEKYLKAFLVHHRREFPRTHDLAELLDLVLEVDSELAQGLGAITALNPYGVEYRYPGDFPDVAENEASEAVKLAGKTRDAIAPLLDLRQ
jgi:HEPN domain-containing protein